MKHNSKKLYWFVAAVDRNNAGYRVRALPLADGLMERGMDVEIHALGALGTKLNTVVQKAHTVVCSKPSTAETYLYLKRLKAEGVVVVIDIFDNYFSWSPFLLARQIPIHWLKFIELADHILVSSPFIMKVIEKLTTTPLTLISDSSPSASDLPTNKQPMNTLSKWPVTNVVHVLWYGISSNPFFKAGLDDLLRWKPVLLSMLKRLRPEMRVQLTISTNSNPMITTVLESFRNAGIDASYQVWDEEDCDRLLESAHLVLLPTNLKGFSLSKTHNRCSNALQNNCLILGSPSGPYATIPGAVFTNTQECWETLFNRDGAKVMKTIQRSQKYMGDEYALSVIADKLFRTIHEISPSPCIKPDTTIVILGQPLQQAEDAITRLNELSQSPIYFSAGHQAAGHRGKLDICMTLDKSVGAPIGLQLSPKGHEALLRVIDSNVPRDHALGSNTKSDDSSGTLFHIDDAGQHCQVSSPDLFPLIKRIHTVRKTKERHTILYAQWTSLQNELLTLVLLKAGFHNLEFATHSHTGWEEFANHADLDLKQSLNTLKQQYNTYENNEMLMGAPVS